MPTYEYVCSNCQNKSEKLQKITDEALTFCEACGTNSLRRGPGGGIGLSFNGSGYYLTDYCRNPSSASDGTAAAGNCCPCGAAAKCS